MKNNPKICHGASETGMLCAKNVHILGVGKAGHFKYFVFGVWSLIYIYDL